ncbi:dephospho-CoA kinase [Pseudactinotalea suaedae]|uniref:dephospho-CoA kinase n=1 Tax=Pseudactinotalea suaedae TaxID=1524924 RepID=UPI0012E2F0D9|nr:dephospho-CoA kinase [Pseudactinotalea suaedae]
MLQVGLTGGIASGKSTVATILVELGAVLIDADRIARDVVELGTPGLEAVKSAFGEEVLRPNGALDRQKLAERVFDDDAALRTLNAIVHPLVREETRARVARLPADVVVVHDVPLIVENHLGAQYHLVVVVGASEAVRIERAVQRGLTESQALARIAAQADDVRRRRAADVWVDNEGTEDELRSVVELLWRARIVPFAENLAAGRWAEAGERVGHREPAHAAQAERLVARIEHCARAGGDRLERVRYREPKDDARIDVIELRARSLTGDLPDDALLPAGFVKVSPFVFASADPGGPAVLKIKHDGKQPSR